MSEQCTHDCSTCSQNCGERQAPESFLEKQNEYSNVKKIIGVVSGKGGVGKSLVTSLLAVTMQQRGYKTAIMDADITGPSIPRSFGITEKAVSDGKYIYPAASENGTKIMSMNMLLQNDTDPVVWRGPVIAGAVKQFYTDVAWSDVDYMFVDMPPGTGDVPLTVFQSLPVDGIVVVTSPQDLVGMIVEKAVKMAALMNIPVLGVVENMAYYECPDCGKKHYIFGEKKVTDIAAQFNLDASAEIPIDPAIAIACDEGKIETVNCSFLSEIADKIGTM